MAVAAPSSTIRTPSPRTMWVLGAVAVLVVGAIVWNVLDESTLTEQRDALVSVDSNDITPGAEFLNYRTAPITSGQADITAVYTGQSGYDMHLFTDPQRAEANFVTHLNAYEHWPEAQEGNTYDASERCFLARDHHFCFGLDGTRSLRSYTLARSDPDGMSALLLLRTARKHWYRFFPPSEQ